MRDLSDILAQCLNEIDENNYTIDKLVEAHPADSNELKSLLHVADRIREARNCNAISAEIRSRSRSSFFEQLNLLPSRKNRMTSRD